VGAIQNPKSKIQNCLAMAIAYFYFHAELNHFLPRHQKQLRISHSFDERASIKDMIESLGVPHPEVDCIKVNDEYVDFSYIVADGDIINVYPISTPIAG
jgi:hypothetical protein